MIKSEEIARKGNLLRCRNTIQTQHATNGAENATRTATPSATINLKALAIQALERNKQRNTAAINIQKQRNKQGKSDVHFVALNLHGYTTLELKKLAGDDWAECESKPQVLEAFAKSVATRKLREQGIKPADYTQASHCQQCGPVWLWEDKNMPDSVQACVWCFNRIKGVDIPRPEPISCGLCRHFISNDHSPSVGVGGCQKGLIGRFTKAKHRCPKFHLKAIGEVTHD